MIFKIVARGIRVKVDILIYNKLKTLLVWLIYLQMKLSDG